MNRRTLLSGAVAALTGVAGCLASGTPRSPTDTPTSTPTPTATPTSQPPGEGSVSLVSFEATGECGDPGTAAVQILESYPLQIVVAGCIVGKNGCTIPKLSDYRYDAATGELTVVVGTREDRDEGEMCTQALVHLGYRAKLSAAVDGLRRVVVVHDGAEGRREVTQVQA